MPSVVHWPKSNVQKVSVNEFKKNWLNTPEILLLDLTGIQTYSVSHIPGAIHLPIARTLRSSGYASGLAPNETELQLLANEFDLLSGKNIVVYDDEGGGWAGRMIWLLDILGVSSITYLDGGLRAWMAADLPLETKVNKPSPAAGIIPAEFNWTPNIDFDEMLAAVQHEEYEIWDARSEAEFMGVRQYAQKAGHIPGASHFDWQEGMDLMQASIIKPLPKILEILNQRGLYGAKPVVTHCQTHHRSGFTYLLGRLLGWQIRAYAGSWSEWGNHPDTPIEQTTVN